MEQYNKDISLLLNPTFQAIRKVSVDHIMSKSKEERDNLWSELNRGTALLNTHDQMCQYMLSYGNMHQAKLLDAFSNMDQSVLNEQIEIIDWGCGQAMGTINLLDYIQDQGYKIQVEKITLIEPSTKALERGVIHVMSYLGDETEVIGIDSYFEKIHPNTLQSNTGNPVIHIFSNIIDVEAIDLKYLSQLLNDTVSSQNNIVCVGPLNPNNKRLDAFFNYFNVPLLYNYSDYNFTPKNWTYRCLIYQLLPDQIDRLVPIIYYPAVYFKAAYGLDVINQIDSDLKDTFFNSFASFETNTPFDLGASVYTDVHPVLAVLNNIISRGIPTKVSPYVEQVFCESFGRTEKKVNLGAISYNDKIKIDRLVAIQSLKKGEKVTAEADLTTIQELLTPIAIARFQKILIEAVLTNRLSLESKKWNILVHERDVPFAHIAMNDFQHLYSNLIGLSRDYNKQKLPKISLKVISNELFYKSPLHIDGKVYKVKTAELTQIEFDMVVDFAMLSHSKITKDEFSEYISHNECYFKVQKKINSTSVVRSLYTSDLINYKNLISAEDSKETSLEEQNSIDKLTYLLQLLFRKETFRPGQLPILNRALQNESVIGLLPTGGGKSLTYQLAALMQPGVTMVIDPLISLMLDQYEGLLANGIDCCTYINSTLSAAERRKREGMLESSQLLMIFISPERLSILDFRRRLSHMHDYNVYFSYAVIDEVHCVSEWGHDFRFSYLHLGRNLYNYVKSKEGHISLFGLTATASFDVLADVERELSGNGAFDLDPDTIVRYENTNRLELQYKIERVPVDFARNTYFDTKGVIDSTLPKPLNINKHFEAYNSKKHFTKNFLPKIPSYIDELQSKESQKKIKTKFNERQGTDIDFKDDLQVDTSKLVPQQMSEYPQAGIIFCPHRSGTGVSVQVLQQQASNTIPNVESFVGGASDMTPLERFRNNKTPLMIATKAFGMGIDKPNVRYTINMNYSSSLESFVQEAGRAGRDKKMALAVILFADYELARVKSDYKETAFPLSMIKGKWYHKTELKKILEFYNIEVSRKDVEIATAQNDIVNLHCTKDNRMFAMNNCSSECNAFNHCHLKKTPKSLRYGWYPEEELKEELQAVGLESLKSHFRYMSADYSTNMFFYNSNFKGSVLEKTFMYRLLSVYNLSYYVVLPQNESNEELLSPPEKTTGFLEALLSQNIGVEIIVKVPYTEFDSINQVEGNKDDISKAIYRLCCIELIEDFTQNYREKYFRIKLTRKPVGQYFLGLERFLLRYFTSERAYLEVQKAKDYAVKNVEGQDEVVTEIHKCLGYLTEFIYDKISEKRKRAINDIRDFCLIGLENEVHWTDRNENLKDFIYYYFNSKYAKSDYVTDTGLAYSLIEDTDGGKKSDLGILIKYLKVTDEDIVGISTPIDNIKHLQGAVRLIRRSLTDSNPVLALLNAYTLFYIGVKDNENLKQRARTDFSEGMLELAERHNFDSAFWNAYEEYNSRLSKVLESSKLSDLVAEIKLSLYCNRLSIIAENYLK